MINYSVAVMSYTVAETKIWGFVDRYSRFAISRVFVSYVVKTFYELFGPNKRPTNIGTKLERVPRSPQIFTKRGKVGVKVCQ